MCAGILPNSVSPKNSISKITVFLCLKKVSHVCDVGGSDSGDCRDCSFLVFCLLLYLFSQLYGRQTVYKVAFKHLYNIVECAVLIYLLWGCDTVVMSQTKCRVSVGHTDHAS